MNIIKYTTLACSNMWCTDEVIQTKEIYSEYQLGNKVLKG